MQTDEAGKTYRVTDHMGKQNTIRMSRSSDHHSEACLLQDGCGYWPLAVKLTGSLRQAAQQHSEILKGGI